MFCENILVQLLDNVYICKKYAEWIVWYPSEDIMKYWCGEDHNSWNNWTLKI